MQRSLRLWGLQPSGAAARFPSEERPLTLAEALTAGSACRAWRRALQASPIVGSLTIGGGELPGKRAWLARARPGVRRLHIPCSAASKGAHALLGKLQGEHTVVAEVGRAPRCLPDPTVLPNLQSLTLNCLDNDAGWLARLAQLPRLASLELSVAAPGRAAAGAPREPLVLSGLPALRCLKTYIEPGALLRVCVDDLPALEEVELWGSRREDEEDRGSAELVPCRAASGEAAAAPSRLRRMSVSLSKVRLDWAAMPALETAQLWAAEVDQGGSSLAAAASLTDLQLGSDAAPSGWPGEVEELALEKPWLLGVLRSQLPPSLRVLRLRGSYLSREAADALARVRGLPVLCVTLHGVEGDAAPTLEAEPGSGPLWEGLRAFRWACRTHRLPKALAAASQLCMLDWASVVPPPPDEQEVALLASLPAVRRLLLEVYTRRSDAGELRQLDAKLRAAMPQLQSLTMDADGRSVGEFLQAAAAAGVTGVQA